MNVAPAALERRRLEDRAGTGEPIHQIRCGDTLFDRRERRDAHGGSVLQRERKAGYSGTPGGFHLAVPVLPRGPHQRFGTRQSNLCLHLLAQSPAEQVLFAEGDLLELVDRVPRETQAHRR